MSTRDTATNQAIFSDILASSTSDTPAQTWTAWASFYGFNSSDSVSDITGSDGFSLLDLGLPVVNGSTYNYLGLSKKGVLSFYLNAPTNPAADTAVTLADEFNTDVGTFTSVSRPSFVISIRPPLSASSLMTGSRWKKTAGAAFLFLKIGTSADPTHYINAAIKFEAGTFLIICAPSSSGHDDATINYWSFNQTTNAGGGSDTFSYLDPTMRASNYIEGTAPNKEVTGVVRDADGNPCSRRVRIYDRASGSSQGETVSDETTGVYLCELDPAFSGEIQRMVLAEDEGIPLENDLIDRILIA